MKNDLLQEYIIFGLLIVIVLVATSYFVYRAAVKFDPYYIERSLED